MSENVPMLVLNSSTTFDTNTIVAHADTSQYSKLGTVTLIKSTTPTPDGTYSDADMGSGAYSDYATVYIKSGEFTSLWLALHGTTSVTLTIYRDGTIARYVYANGTMAAPLKRKVADNVRALFSRLNIAALLRDIAYIKNGVTELIRRGNASLQDPALPIAPPADAPDYPRAAE